MSENSKTATERNPPENGKFRCFTFELYPDCEPHMMVLRLVERFPKIYRAVYILHDRDRYSPEDYEDWKADHEGEAPNWSVGDVKKSHYHVMVTFPSARHVSSVADFFGLKKVLPVSCKESLLQYFIHADIKSQLNEYKYKYDVSDVQGDQKTVMLLYSQNAHFVQLVQVVRPLVKQGMLMIDIYDVLASHPDADTLLSTWKEYGNMITSACMQYTNSVKFSIKDI